MILFFLPLKGFFYMFLRKDLGIFFVSIYICKKYARNFTVKNVTTYALENFYGINILRP